MNKIICADVIEGLRQLPRNSVNMCVTSPPYYGLRDYGTATWTGGDSECNHYRHGKTENSNTGHQTMTSGVGDSIYRYVCGKCGAVRVEDKQIGLEDSPTLYVRKMVEVFREVKRVLKDDGTLWLNIGDGYAGGSKGGGEGYLQSTNVGSLNVPKVGMAGCKQKDLYGVPWALAFALRADGWYLRQDIIWHKKNPMPEPVKDRFTKSHEYLFLLSKNPDYYFNTDAVKEKAVYPNDDRGARTDSRRGTGYNHMSGKTGEYRNKRDVWSISTRPYKGAHFATFPPDLIRPCILAGSRHGDLVLDPFMGSGTTAVVALEEGRQYVGVELNPEYVKLAEDRIAGVVV